MKRLSEAMDAKRCRHGVFAAIQRNLEKQAKDFVHLYPRHVQSQNHLFTAAYFL